MTKDDIDKIEDGTYYAENCPFYAPYWSKEKNPYDTDK